MVFRVSLAPQAVRELDGIADYIRTRGSFERAERWFNQIFAEIHSLAEFPLRCHVDPVSSELGIEIRLLLHGRRHRQYKIYYTVNAAQASVAVIQVRHWARRQPDAGEFRQLLGGLG